MTPSLVERVKVAPERRDREQMRKLPGRVHLSLFRKMRREIEVSKAFRGVESILVGTSGGIDSNVLLHLLCALRDKGGPRVIATHVHHGIRGEEAERDAKMAE